MSRAQNNGRGCIRQVSWPASIIVSLVRSFNRTTHTRMIAQDNNNSWLQSIRNYGSSSTISSWCSCTTNGNDVKPAVSVGLGVNVSLLHVQLYNPFVVFFCCQRSYRLICTVPYVVRMRNCCCNMEKKGV